MTTGDPPGAGDLRGGSPPADRRLLLVGDTPLFCQTIAAILSAAAEPSWAIRQTTYARFASILSPRLLQDTDLTVLDLWRRYPSGLRAEGLAVAETLARLGGKALVVSPLALPVRPEDSSYWDLASGVCLPERIRQLLLDTLPAPGLPDHIKQALAPFQQAPDGHAEARSAELPEA